jgi:integrase
MEPAPDGRRRQRTYTFRSERDAVEAQARIRSQVTARTYVEPARITVAGWMDDWLSINERTWRPSTTASYRLALKPAREAFGATRLQSLARADVETLVRSMLTSGGRTRDGRSPRTVALLLTILRKCLNDAEAEGLIATNPAARVKKPARQEREMHTWTAQQMTTFLDAVDDDPLVGAWHLSALGLRRGEVLGLRWSDIDFEAGVLHVRQARVQAGREVVTNEPKTARGRRSLPMHPALTAALKATRERTVTNAAVVPIRQRGADGARLVAVDAAGEPIRPDAYSDLFATHVKAAGLPPIRLHDLRHSALSLLLQQGVPVHVVAKLAGHDPSVTLRTYAHAQDAAVRAAVHQLGALYGTR